MTFRRSLAAFAVMFLGHGAVCLGDTTGQITGNRDGFLRGGCSLRPGGCDGAGYRTLEDRK
jgi:hypothetical protein